LVGKQKSQEKKRGGPKKGGEFGPMSEKKKKLERGVGFGEGRLAGARKREAPVNNMKGWEVVHEKML